MKRNVIPSNKSKDQNKDNTKGTNQFLLDIEKIEHKLNELFPFGLVPRTEIERATGGILCARTMSNLDSINEGIAVKVCVGKKVCYPISSVIEYISLRVKTKAA